MNKKLLLFSLLMILLVTLMACDIPFSPYANKKNTANEDFYKGSQGVIMKFSDPSNPPSRMYFYGDADPDDNKFDILVDVQNIGSSWTKGGLYVSGYDPNMIRIDQIDIPKLNGGWGDCVMNFGLTGMNANTGGEVGNFWNSIIGNIGCSETGLNAYFDGGSEWGIGIESLGQLFGFDQGILSGLGIHYDNQNGNPAVSFNLADSFNFDYLNHGKGFLILMSGLSFERYNGEEYILHPDDYDYPGGEMTTIAFNGQIREWPKGLDKTERPMPFLVTNCYLYTTYAAPQVCIDPAPMDLGRKVCTPRRITFNGGNGAPVAISSIEQENTKKRIYFTINIQNVGHGQIFDMGYMERCSPYYPGRLTTRQLDKAYLMDVRIGNQQLRCTPDRGDGVRLVNGRGQVKCTYDLQYQTAKSAYETPLIVELAYGYAESMERRMMIKRAS